MSESAERAGAAALGLAGRMAAAFQNNPLTPLLALVALLLGAFAILITPREEEPQINVTMANVMIAFPGASSSDVQNMVALPAEQVLAQIAGIEHTYSVARPGMAIVTVQFKVGVPRTEALVRLYDVLNANQNWLPRDLGTLTPVVLPKGIDDVPVVAVTLWSADASSAAELAPVAHTMEAELTRIPGVREVKTIGAPGRVLQVALDPARLRERGVDVQRLSDTLAAANLAMPSGRVIGDPSVADAPRMLAVETGMHQPGSRKPSVARNRGEDGQAGRDYSPRRRRQRRSRSSRTLCFAIRLLEPASGCSAWRRSTRRRWWKSCRSPGRRCRRRWRLRGWRGGCRSRLR